MTEAASPPDTGIRHRTAPITPVVTTVRALPILVVIALVNLPRAQSFGLLGTLLGAAVVAGVIAGFAWLSWQRLTFWFDADGDFRVDSGVLQRRERRLQLSRLQSVDVVQPLLARVFGMAQLKVEVAGSTDSRVTLSYLTVDRAGELRAEILARSAGVRHDAGEAPESIITTVPTPVLLLSGVLSVGLVSGVIALVLVSVLAVLFAGPMAAFGLVIAVAVPGLAIFGYFTSNFNFTVADSPDGLRIRHGLLGVEARTVPPGRVAAIDFVEPLLWRPKGWVAVRLTVAGAAGGDSGDEVQKARLLLPVATWDVAREVVARILPGVDPESVELLGVPARVRRRSPIQWRHLGLGTDDRVVVATRGRITRHTTVTPHARVQSVRLTQGPWERPLGLASVHFDVVPGQVRAFAPHRPREEARAFAFAEVERARLAGRADRSVRWARAQSHEDAAAPTSATTPNSPAEPVANAPEPVAPASEVVGAQPELPPAAQPGAQQERD